MAQHVELIPIINGGLFAQAGPTASHYTYDIIPITNFVALAGSETPPYVRRSNLT